MSTGRADPSDQERQSRRSFLRSGVGVSGVMAVSGVLAACGDSSSPSAASSTSSSLPAAPVTNGTEALQRVVAGNKRFTSGNLQHRGSDDVRRAELAESQAPYAVILGCSDSRVPPEIIFDEGIGDLFTVRVAGNTAATGVVQGTIEYGTAVLGSVLVLVLGHENCGAVKAALDQVKAGPTVPGQIASVVDPIIAAAQAVSGEPADRQLAEAIDENVRLTVAHLMSLEPVLAPAVRANKVLVAGAVYDFKTGAVDILS
jgi:carbonic anhydrase